MDDGFLLWPSNSTFDDFYFYLDNFLPPIRFNFEKEERIKNEKGEKLQTLIFFILNKQILSL